MWTDEATKKWLSELKVGDKFVVGEHIGNDYYVCEIDKITAKQFVTKGGKRFRREDGREIGYGDSFYHPYMEPITDKVREQLARQRIRRMLSKLELSKLDFEKLKKLHNVLDEVTHE